MTQRQTQNRKPYRISDLDAAHHARIADLLVRGEAQTVGAAISIMNLGEADRRRLYRQRARWLPAELERAKRRHEVTAPASAPPTAFPLMVQPALSLSQPAIDELTRMANRHRKLVEGMMFKFTPAMAGFKAHQDLVRNIVAQYDKAIPRGLIEKMQPHRDIMAGLKAFSVTENSALGRLLMLRQRDA